MSPTPMFQLQPLEARVLFAAPPPGSVFYDIVTSPLETDFLKAASAAGFRTVDGLSMLIGQADHAFAHLFGTRPPRDGDTLLRREIAG